METFSACLEFESREVGRDASGWLGRSADICSFLWLTDGVSFLLFCRSLTETMLGLWWSEGKWKTNGKDLETAMQSKEARSCTV